MQKIFFQLAVLIFAAILSLQSCSNTVAENLADQHPVKVAVGTPITLRLDSLLAFLPAGSMAYGCQTGSTKDWDGEKTRTVYYCTCDGSDGPMVAYKASAIGQKNGQPTLKPAVVFLSIQADGVTDYSLDQEIVGTVDLRNLDDESGSCSDPQKIILGGGDAAGGGVHGGKKKK